MARPHPVTITAFALGLSLVYTAPVSAQSLQSLTGEYHRRPIENGWHSGEVVTKQEDGKEILEWVNDSGAKWNLYPNRERGALTTGPRNPYRKNGASEFFLEYEGKRLFGFTFNNELYLRKGEAPPKTPEHLEIPVTDEGLPGSGTIRRYDWFRKLWAQKRSKWSRDVRRDQGAVVFFGDSITQGWGDDMGGSFGDTRVANRGISGDTTRGMLLRIERDVLAVNPSGVVMLMGTNDLEERDSAESIAANVRAIVDRLVAHDPKVSIILCKVFPSSARMRRSSTDIERINELCTEAVEGVSQVTVLDTWSIFANDQGDAKKEEFPDLLHPNKLGYDKWAAALRPELAKITASRHPNAVVWEGEGGIGKGKHIVFIAGDHEYRGEETLPALARILAKRHGFKCTFLVTTNEDTGDIEPGSDHITGLEALATADLMVVFLRFQRFADDQMQHLEDYLNSGKPVIGLRTSTHAFKGLKGKWAKYNEGFRGEDDAWRFGFGEHILGEHWVGHFGSNHRQSSNLILEPDQLAHPVLRGVTKAHAMCGGYVGHPKDGVTLARGQVLDGMTSDSPPSKQERQQTRHSVAWVRTYQPDNPRSRVFATTHGASEDIVNEGFRRMLINAHFWCLGMEADIQEDLAVGFVGPYHPTTFNFGGYRRGVKPHDISGWEAPIYDPDKPIRDMKRK
jgi:lysophospholipase L1-like esterase